MTIDAQALWGIPEPPNTIKIVVTHACGHKERYPFEGIEQADGYHMPRTEADRLYILRARPCDECLS